VPDLEEHTLDPAIPRRCEECGAQLTKREIEATLESGGRPLCSVHAAEEVPVAEEDPALGEGA
jgi:hypothetical protein